MICLYFLEQLGSGHSSRTGEGGGLLQAVDAGWTGMKTGAATLAFLLLEACVPAAGDSSSPVRPFRLLVGSGRGGIKGVGDDGAVEDPVEEPLAPAPRRPFTPPVPPPPFRSLLCTDDRVSVKLLMMSVLGVETAAEERPRLPLPFGVRVSKSLVGESQNLQKLIL